VWFALVESSAASVFPSLKRAPWRRSQFGKNITLSRGPAPVRAYIEQLLPAVLNGTVNPSAVFDQTVQLEQTPKGYTAKAGRTVLKAMVDAT